MVDLRVENGFPPVADRSGTMAAMLGAAIIVLVLVIAIPVAVLMSGSIGALLIGWFLRNEADATHEGSELIDLNG